MRGILLSIIALSGIAIAIAEPVKCTLGAKGATNFADDSYFPFREVEYIETAGNDYYFNTGITSENGLRCICEIEYTLVPYEDAKGTIFGGLITSPSVDGCLLNLYQYRNVCQTRWGPNPYYYFNIQNKEFGVGERHCIDVSMTSGNAWLVVDGETMYTSSAIVSHQYVLPIYVNRIYYANSQDKLFPTGGGYVRYYSLRFYDGYDNLLRDFVPVRIGKVGYMYDSVTGEFFGNEGSSPFIIGPDKEIQ